MHDLSLNHYASELPTHLDPPEIVQNLCDFFRLITKSFKIVESNFMINPINIHLAVIISLNFKILKT